MFCCFIVVCCIRYMKHLGCFGFCGVGVDCGADLVLVLVGLWVCVLCLVCWLWFGDALGCLGCWWYALVAVFVVSVNCAIYGCLGFIIGFMGLCVDCLFCLFVLVCCFSWLVIVVLLLVIACLWFGI